MFDILLSAVLGYLLGSLPSAFLLVQWKARKDIREAGSGNVGALNSYLVTRSRAVGAAVLVLDLLKGVAAVALAQSLFDRAFPQSAVAGIAAVLGHNFSVWLKFKGGRGLSTAAGVALMLAWPIIPVWALLWGIGFYLTRNVNVGNALATLLLIVGGLTLPASILEKAAAGPTPEIRAFIVAMFLIVLIKHFNPVREFARKRRRLKGSERTEAETEKETS